MAGREAKRNDERLYYKFIVEYFKNMHKDLFTKATNLHEEVKKMNPHVRDLTKTAEFMTTVTPNIPVPAYYYRRQLKPTIKQTIKQKIQRGSTMVLEIPLNKQPSPSVTVSSLPVTVPSPPSTVLSPPPQTEPLLMEDNTFQQLLAEIQKDPDLHQIFNGFNNNDDDDDDDDMNSHVWNDFYIPDDVSPLEITIDGMGIDN